MEMNTDKYEGHTPAPWCIDLNEGSENDENPNGLHIYTLRLQENVAPFPISSGLPIAQHVGDNVDAQLIADAPLILEAYKRLLEALVGDSEDWTTDELVEKALTLYDKALAFDTIYDWYERMQLQSESYENELWRMDWLLKNPTKEYEDYDTEYDEE